MAALILFSIGCDPAPPKRVPSESARLRDLLLSLDVTPTVKPENEVPPPRHVASSSSSTAQATSEPQDSPSSTSQDAWIRLGLERTYITQLELDSTVPGRIWAFGAGPRTSLGTLFRSDDDGATWRVGGNWSSGFRSDIFVGGIAIDSHGALYLPDLGSVLISADAGLSWRIVRDVSGGVITVASHELSQIYMCNGSRFSRSSDGGNTWDTLELRPVSMVSVTSIAMDPNQVSTVYVGGGSGLFKSTDSGSTWERLLDLYSVSVATSRTNSNLVYVGNMSFASTSGADPRTGVWRSEDGGVTWVQVNADMRVQRLILDPRDPTETALLAESGNAFFWSPDGGVTWTALGSPSPPNGLSPQQDFAISGNRLLAGRADGIWMRELEPLR
jgi:photosystem II stability/assembly factor-like uncharacterized protein